MLGAPSSFFLRSRDHSIEGYQTTEGPHTLVRAVVTTTGACATRGDCAFDSSFIVLSALMHARHCICWTVARDLVDGLRAILLCSSKLPSVVFSFVSNLNESIPISSQLPRISTNCVHLTLYFYFQLMQITACPSIPQQCPLHIPRSFQTLRCEKSKERDAWTLQWEDTDAQQ
jgi:hypothetical protein